MWTAADFTAFRSRVSIVGLWTSPKDCLWPEMRLSQGVIVCCVLSFPFVTCPPPVRGLLNVKLDPHLHLQSTPPGACRMSGRTSVPKLPASVRLHHCMQRTFRPSCSWR